MKRLSILVGVGAIVPITSVMIWILVQPADPINAANFDRIDAGMTESQVEKILSGLASGEIQLQIHGQWEDIRWPKTWSGRGCRVITVYFQIRAGQSIVDSKELFDPSLWDRVKAWWGDYELDPHTIGGRTKRLEAAA
jgi:hypothetical protein